MKQSDRQQRDRAARVEQRWSEARQASHASPASMRGGAATQGCTAASRETRAGHVMAWPLTLAETIAVMGYVSWVTVMLTWMLRPW